MADKDVNLIIRAKNAASKEIKTVADALKFLAGQADDAGGDIQKTTGILGKLGDQFKKLASQTASLNALDKIGQFMGKAATAAENLKGEVAGLQAELAKTSKAEAEAKVQTETLAKSLEDLRATQAKQKAEQKSARDEINRDSEAKKKLTAANKELALSNALSTKNPERGARITAATAGVNSAQAVLDTNTAKYDEITAKVRATNAEIKSLDTSVTVSEKNWRGLTNEVGNLTTKLAQAETNLAKGASEMAEIAAIADTAKKSIGVLATEEAQLGAAIGKITPEVDRLSVALAALQKYSKGNNAQYVDSKTAAAFQKQREAIAQTEIEWKALEALVRDAALAIKATENPTEEQTASFKELANAARAASKEHESLVAGLGRLQNAASKTAAEFLKETAPLEGLNTKYERNKQAILDLSAAMERYSTGSGKFTNSEAAEALRSQGAAVEAARARYVLLSAEVQRLRGVMESSNGATAENAAALKATAQAANQAQIEYKQTAVALRELNNSTGGGKSIFGSFNESGRESLSLFQRLRGEILSMTAAFVGFYGAIQGISGVLDSYKQLEAAQNRLGAVFHQNNAAVGREMQFLQSESSRLGINFGTLSDQYGKFAIAAQAANFSGEQTRKVFISVAEAGRVNKLSLDDMNGVFLALTQMISKGKVQAEELRGQLGERLPGAFNIFADAVGKSTAELGDLMKNGEVLADSDTLIKFADELDKRFGPQLAKSLTTTTTLMGSFSNAIFNAQLQFANGGFIESFNKLLGDMMEWFKSSAGHDFFLALGAAAGHAVDAVAFFARNIDLIITGLKALAAIKVAGFVVGIASAFEKAIVSAKTWVGTNEVLIKSNNDLKAGITGGIASIVNWVKNLGTVVTANKVVAASNVALAAETVRTTTAQKAAAAGAAIVEGSLTVLRVAMNTTATAARALWTALGGWVGVAAAVVSFLASTVLTGWATSVTDVTKTLDEHSRLMNLILEKYQGAAKGAQTWANALKDLPLDALEANARNVGKLYDELKTKIAGFGGEGGRISAMVYQAQAGVGDADFQRIYDQASKLTKAFDEGKISAEQLNEGLTEIYSKGGPTEDAKVYLNQLLDLVRTEVDYSTKVDQARDAVDKKTQSTIGATDKYGTLRGSMDGVTGALSNMAKATGDANTAMDDGKKAADQYQESLEKIESFIPGLAAKLKSLKDIGTIQDEFGKVGFNGITPQMAREGAEAIKVILSDEDKATFKQIAGNTSKVTPEMFSNIFKEENYKPNAYNDGYGTQTIGYGSTRINGRAVQAGDTVSKEQAMQMAISELDGIIAGIEARVKVGLSAQQMNALVSYAYNAGIGSLKRDGILGPLNNGDYKGAENAIRNGVTTSGGKDVPGLHTRRAREADMFARGADDPAVIKSQYETEQKITDEKEKQAKATTDSIAGLQQDADLAKIKAQEGEKAALMAKAEADARKANPSITAAEVDQIKKLTALKYDNEHLDKESTEDKKKSKELLDQVTALEEKRTGLIAKRKYYEEQGDNKGVTDTNAALVETNKQLTDAIDAAIKFQEALGGAASQKSIEALNNQKQKIAETNIEGKKFAMTATEMSQSISSSLESGIIGAFDSFAQAIANGENAVTALKDAFLQFAANFLREIATMILKQILFNALQSIGKAIGGGLFSLTTGGLFHSGGVVGAGGGGGTSAAISPSIFAMATRYHSGGIAGLAPDEVPAVLKKGEEVLTDTDQRHRKNGGGKAAKSNTKVVNLFDSGSFLSEALNSPIGQETILNHVRANPAAFRQAINS